MEAESGLRATLKMRVYRVTAAPMVTARHDSTGKCRAAASGSGLLAQPAGPLGRRQGQQCFA